MTVQLFAQPYDQSASGFYFENAEDYQTKSKALKNDYGEAVEEFEIQFIDGSELDCALFKALGIHQGDIATFFQTSLEWEEWEKINVIIAVGECGYSFDFDSDTPDQYDISIYNVDSLKELAIEFINDGILGEIPKHLENYIDIDAFAADLRHDYTETVIASMPIVYRAD